MESIRKERLLRLIKRMSLLRSTISLKMKRNVKKKIMDSLRQFQKKWFKQSKNKDQFNWKLLPMFRSLRKMLLLSWNQHLKLNKLFMNKLQLNYKKVQSESRKERQLKLKKIRCNNRLKRKKNLKDSMRVVNNWPINQIWHNTLHKI